MGTETYQRAWKNRSASHSERRAAVGESGSGESVTALSVTQLVGNPGRIEQGEITDRGESLLDKSEKEMRKIRGNEIAMVFQDPMTSLNPVYTIGQQIGRVVKTHEDVSDAEARERAIELMSDVGIPEPESRAVSDRQRGSSVVPKRDRVSPSAIKFCL